MKRIEAINNAGNVPRRVDGEAPPPLHQSMERQGCDRYPHIASDGRRSIAQSVRFVAEWAAQHQEELQEAWELSQKGQPPKKIGPLV